MINKSKVKFLGGEKNLLGEFVVGFFFYYITFMKSAKFLHFVELLKGLI